MKHVEYRVVSDSEGHITERDTREAAEKRAQEPNKERGVPDDHTVERHEEVLV